MIKYKIYVPGQVHDKYKIYVPRQVHDYKIYVPGQVHDKIYGPVCPEAGPYIL